MLNLATILRESARRYPDKKALVWNDVSLTFKELDEVSDTFAHYMVRQLGLGRGDKIALTSLNNPQFVMSYYGILKMGGVAVALSALLNPQEIAALLEDSGAKAYCCYEGEGDMPIFQGGEKGFTSTDTCKHLVCLDRNWNEDKGESLHLSHILSQKHIPFPLADTAAQDTALIMYTSGTTGQPKGTEMTHFNLLINATVGVRELRYTESDKNIIALPISHIFSHTMQLNASILNGNTSILLSKFSPQAFLDWVKKEQPTIFCGVPTMYWALNNIPCDSKTIEQVRQSMRLCVSGGAPLSAVLQQQFENKFGVQISEIFGMTESSGCVCFNYYPESNKSGTIGPAVWGMEVNIFDENDQPVPVGEKGELVFRGHSVMKGYLNQPEATSRALRNGWMHSGDVAYMDANGYVYIIDRIKEMIIRGGWKIYPREVEEVLMQHPAVNMVAVVGVADEKYGEEIKALIIRETETDCTEEDIISYAREHMAKYKYPRLIEFVNELPLSKTGKVLKKLLK